MGDKEFERPGSPPRPAPDHWPYHAPTPGEPPEDLLSHFADAPPRDEVAPPRRRARLLATLVLGVVAGAVLGGMWVASRQPPSESPAAITLTVSSFPRQLLGNQRNDVELREAGFGPTIERLDSEFEDQRASYRFAYGGDGATLGYGRMLTLTIVNGILPPNLPREGRVDQNGRASQTRRLISLRADDVSCTFEPQPVIDPDSKVAQLGDLGSEGITDCVLLDVERNLSLRITQVNVLPDGDAFSTSASFRDELQRLHGALVD